MPDKLLRIFLSTSFDPAVNLSLEEFFMENLLAGELIFLLWQSRNTIVIGRNQNPYKECDIKKVEKDQVTIIRRLSGGGAVFQDEGNLNFTFITKESSYSIQKNIQVILNALQRFGIHGEFNGRNDLVAAGRKFSGNAFIYAHGAVCHHGTILVEADIEKLSNYLVVSEMKLASKGIDSVRSRVVNLKEVKQDITIEKLKSALVESCINVYSDYRSETSFISKKDFKLSGYLNKYNSWRWNFGESPDFAVVLEDKFYWGMLEINLNLSNGRIAECKIYTDSLYPKDFEALEQELVNKEFKGHILAKAALHCIKDSDMAISIADFINNRIGCSGNYQ